MEAFCTGFFCAKCGRHKKERKEMVQGRGKFVILSVVACLTILANCSYAIALNIIDLSTIGVLSDDGTRVHGINDNGDLVGVYLDGPDDRAFLWEFGSPALTDLGDLGGDWSEAYGVNANSNGQVVGWAENADYTQHAFLWEGSMIDLGTLGESSLYSSAYGINDSGQVVGKSEISETDYRAFIWDGSMTDINSLTSGPGWNKLVSAAAINNLGHVVGTGETTGNDDHAFFWDGGAGAPVDLDPLGTENSHAYGINDKGQIVGMVGTHAVLWQDDTIIDLHDLVLNAGLGQWTSLTEAWDINNNGQIVGMGIIDGMPRSFLMTLPEPMTFSLLAVGGLALLRRRRSRG